ncbi:MAG TPA: class I SAM-dependent methyltransferase [Patescibacteria group bacterium]|nr:class I SAM-dependent methyltransferase [Patescibacteria group bacterium]
MIFEKIKSNLRHVYDELAHFWGDDFTLHDWGQKELAEFAELVKKNGGRVLDCGCGSGVQSKELFDRGLEVVGMDLSPKMVSEAKKRVPKAKFAVGDMTKMNFTKGSFGGVYVRASLLHIPKKLVPKVLKSINKILKNGGILYLALKEGKGEGEVANERFGKKVRRFFSFFSEQEVLDFLKESGFVLLKKSKRQRTKNSTLWLQFLARKV